MLRAVRVRPQRARCTAVPLRVAPRLAVARSHQGRPLTPLQRGYAKAAHGGAQAKPATEESEELETTSKAPEEDDTSKKQQVVPGPVPLSFWYTSDKEYIDENYMRARDMYRVETFDLQEPVRLRAKEFEQHLDEFKRRSRVPHFTEYLKNQQQAVAEYRPLLRAAIKDRRTAYKDFLGSIDKKIETESKVTKEQLVKMSTAQGSKTIAEMGENFQTVHKKFLEGVMERMGELSQEEAGEELLGHPVDTLERDVFMDYLPTTTKGEGSNVLDNMLMGEWFPEPKHLETGADNLLKDWHKRKDFLRSHSKLKAYGLRAHDVTDGPPPKDYHQKQTAELNKRAREVAEKLTMPAYLRLPPIPKDASPTVRAQAIKLQILIHEARRYRLALHRRDLDQEETRKHLQELQAAINNPTGFEGFLAATPRENNYQLAAFLIQMQQAQILVAKGDVKREELMSFEEAVSVLRRIVADRNIPFKLLPPESDSSEAEALVATLQDGAPGTVGKTTLAPAAAESNLLNQLRDDAAPAPAVPAVPAAPTATPAAGETSAPAMPEIPEEEAPITSPVLEVGLKTGEPLPALPRVSLEQTLSTEEMEMLEKELRDLEITEMRVTPNAEQYITELRNMLDAYSVGPRDFSFLDKQYDVELSHRWSFHPEIGNPHAKKLKVMRERRVRMSVKVESLGLPMLVRERLVLIAGPRYDKATDKLTICSDAKPSSFQNMRYVKKLLQRLIAEAYLVHPRYVSMDDLTPPKPVKLGPKIALPKQLPQKFGIFRFRRPLFLDSEWPAEALHPEQQAQKVVH